MKTLPIITWILILCLSGFMRGQAQSITLTFSGIKDGQAVALNRIEIQNLDKGCDTTLYYPNSSLTLQPMGIGNRLSDPDGFTLFQNVPNTAGGQTVIRIFQPEKGHISVVVTELTGRQVASFSGELSRGYHAFNFVPGSSETYIFSAERAGVRQSIRIISGPHSVNRSCLLSYTGTASIAATMKTTFLAGGFIFSLGDHLRFTGHYGTFTSVIEDTPQSNSTYTFDFSPAANSCPGNPTVTYGGQVYHTVQIGTQCWFRENLNIGTRINGSQDQTNNGIIEKYCYGDNEANCNTYGGLYQWDELMQYVSTEGAKGLCPDGWHIPTDAEWSTLTTYLGGESVAGGKMKEAGTSHWASPNAGATNSSGFTALPGGSRYYGGNFVNLTYNAYFWSSSQYDDSIAWYRNLYYDNEIVFRYYYYYKT
jgi:uncharacterized protein (TIGR02145 family)